MSSAGKRVELPIGPPRSEASPVTKVRPANRRGRFRHGIELTVAAKPGRYVLLACRNDCAKKRKARFTITQP